MQPSIENKIDHDVGKNIVHVIDLTIQTITESNNDITNKGKEVVNRGLWLVGVFLGLLTLGSNMLQSSAILAALAFAAILSFLFTCLFIGYYIWRFLKVGRVNVVNYEQYAKNYLYEKNYAEVIKYYISEMKSVQRDLLKINSDLDRHLKRLYVIFMLLPLIFLLTVAVFLIFQFCV